MSKKSAGKNQAADVIVTAAFKLWMEADGITRVKALPGVRATLKRAEEIVAAYKLHFADSSKQPILIDIRAASSISKNARDYCSQSELLKFRSRIAILVGSPVSRILGSFVSRFANLKQPVHIFRSESRALAWLRNGS